MNNPAYSQNAYSKLQLYTTHGIIPTIQLITTFETKEKTLDTDMVEKIIAHFSIKYPQDGENHRWLSSIWYIKKDFVASKLSYGLRPSPFADLRSCSCLAFAK